MFIDVFILADTMMLGLYGILDEDLIRIVDSSLNCLLMFDLFIRVMV